MRTRTLTTALAALALALTAGCGSSADVAADDGGSASAAADSSAGGGAGDGATVLTTSNFADEITGAQLKAQTTRLTMTMSMGGQTMKAEADVKTASDPLESAMDMSMDMSGESMKIIMVDGVIYTKAEGMTGGVLVEASAGEIGGDVNQLRLRNGTKVVRSRKRWYQKFFPYCCFASPFSGQKRKQRKVKKPLAG